MKALGIKERTTIKGHYRFTLSDTVTGLERVFEYDNIVPLVGRERINEALAGDITDINQIQIHVCALGTGTTTPADGDTTLETETYRKAIASSTADGDKLYVTAFYTELETSGVFTEAGLFVNADDSITDDGILFSRVAVSITKSTSETLTIDYTFTLN